MQFRNQTLPNGLEVVAECDEKAYSTAIGFFVKAGARDENGENAGVSHFLEHMVFKGTPRRSAEDVNRELDEIGSQSNAHTTEEQTAYYAFVLPEYQEQVVELLADLMRPSLRESDFEMEKKVILEEIYKYDDQPPYGAYEKCMEAYFNGHPLGHNVLGTVETIRAMTPGMMLEYFRGRYNPANIVLAATGRVDFPALVASAEQYCGAWESREAPRRREPVSPARGRLLRDKESAVQRYAVRISPGPAAEHSDRYAARLLTTILGDDSGSRLYWELVETGLAECAALSPAEYQGAGVLLLYLGCADDQFEQNLQQIEQILAEAVRDGVTQNELELAVSKTTSNVILSSERPSHRLFSVGNGWIQRRQYRSVAETIEAYRSVTLDQVNQMMEKYPLDMAYTVSVGPPKEE